MNLDCVSHACVDRVLWTSSIMTNHAIHQCNVRWSCFNEGQMKFVILEGWMAQTWWLQWPVLICGKDWSITLFRFESRLLSIIDIKLCFCWSLLSMTTFHSCCGSCLDTIICILLWSFYMAAMYTTFELWTWKYRGPIMDFLIFWVQGLILYFLLYDTCL